MPAKRHVRLSPKAFALLQATILDLYDCRTLPEFKQAIPQVLLRAVPADHFGWQICRPGPAVKIRDEEKSAPMATPEILELWAGTMAEHPCIQGFIIAGDAGALGLSGCVDQSQVSCLPAFRIDFGAMRIRYSLSVPTTGSRGVVGALTFLRERRDFTETDRTMLDLLGPHVSRARDNAEHLSAMASRGGALRVEERKERFAKLTGREREVGHWIAQGKTNPEIAQLLEVSPRTIDKHVERILAKLGVENRTTAALMLLEPRPR